MISERFILATLAWKQRTGRPLFKLAHRLGVSPSWVSGIMRGQIPALQGDRRLHAWARIIGTPPNQIFEERKSLRGNKARIGRRKGSKGVG